MNIIFNELSCKNLAPTKEIASNWLSTFFDTLFTLGNRLHCKVYISSSIKFQHLQISTDFSFSEWLGKLNRDHARQIINALQYNILLKDDIVVYYYNEMECKGLGVAHLNNEIAISYPDDNTWVLKTKIQKHFFTANETVNKRNVHVYNLSKKSNVYDIYPLRIFEHNEKHDKGRPNLNDGESTLYYHVPNENILIQTLLDHCYGASDVSATERVYCYDISQKKYMEFNCHLHNKFHGYHIIDSNRVHQHIKDKIDNHPYVPIYPK